MLRRLGVRGKILATLAVPVLVLVFAAVFISAQSLQEVRVTRAISDALSALQANRVFIDALQEERTAGVLHAGEIRFERRLPFLDEEERLSPAEEEARAERAEERAKAYDAAMVATDATRGRAEARLAGISYDLLDPLVRNAVDRVIESRERIAEVRTAVESGNLAPNLVDRQYSLVLAQDVGLIEQFAGTIDNRSLGTYLNAYALVDETVEHIKNERGFGFYALEGDGREASARDYLVGLFPEATTTHARARQAVGNLGNPDIEMPDWGAKSETFTDFMNLRSRLQVSTLQDWIALSEDVWLEQSTVEVEALEPTLAALWTAVDRNAAAAESGARTQATLTILIALLAVAASVAVALLVGRTIVVPLSRLTEAAGEVRDQLPRLVEQVATPGEGPDLSLVQIPVDSDDEVGRLAAAFNEVNQKTVEVAQEQAALRGSIAEMFVNVARRDQVLLNRQLSFIDTLEREEEDPNTLANLFRLDHLATRMRRNAESLLVLAGIDSGRRVRGSMTLSDVIRTATSEIEQYERINLVLGVDPHMHGFNSLPAAHLLAEILENATVFSEPGTMVDVFTSAEIEFITVTVVDRGLGMSAEDIKEANERVRETTASEVVGAQRLGLHVVGRIASRLGTRVLFAPAQGGTEVRVRFPRALFVDDAKEAQPDSGGRVLTADEIGAQEAVPVDLEALTDGETALGLPRRRASEAAGAPGPTPLPPRTPEAPAPQPGAPAAPAQPAAAAPPTTASGLPSRRNIVLPEVATPQIAPDVAAEAAAGWSPQVAAPASGGLPSRAAGASFAALPKDDAPAAPPRPAAAELAPEERSGMFAGFRRGPDLPQAGEASTTSADAAPAPQDEAPVETPQEPAEPPLVIPGFQDDDEPVAPAATAPVEHAPSPGVPPLEEEQPAAWSAPAVQEQPAAWDAPAQEQPAAWDAPAQEQPAAWDAPAQEPVAESPSAWSPSTDAAPAPAWGEQPAPASWAEQAPAAWDAGTAQSPAAPQEYVAPEQPAAFEQAAGAEQPEQPEPAPAPWQDSVPAAQTWGPSEPAWTPDEASATSAPSASTPYAAPQTAATPYAAPELEPEAPAASQFPAFSPESGYAPPVEQSPAWQPQTPHVEPEQQPGYEAASAPGAAGWSPAAPTQQGWETPAPAQQGWDTTQAPAQQGWETTQPAASPQGWQAAPAQDWQAAPVAPSPEQPTAAPTWAPTEQPAPPPAAQPAAEAALPTTPAVTPLPTFSDLVAQEEAPSRRSRRGGASKPSWAERRAAKREERARAKAEARELKKSKGRAPATPEPKETPDAAPAPGFFSQPTSIAALRAEEPAAPAAAPAPAPEPAAWSAPAPPATPAPQQPAASTWGATSGTEHRPAPATPAAFEPASAPEEPFAPALQQRKPATETPVPAQRSSFSPGASAWAPDGGAATGGARQFGVLDDEVAAMLALRSDIQEQALSELSQLSAYRPKVVQEASSLTRRTPTAIPSAPELSDGSSTPKERDPEALRSRLSSFQSGATRGRRAQPPPNPAPSSDGAAPQANGSAEHAAPEGPPSDTSQEAQTW